MEQGTGGTKMRLNLGCGAFPIADGINHDIVAHSDYVDTVWNLDKMPWPWENEEFEGIIAKAVLEHLHWTLLESINECWRILKPGGHLYVKVPCWDSYVSHQDPTHRWFYAPRVFEYFDPEMPLGKKYHWYTPLKWRLVKPGGLNSGSTSIHATLEKLVDVD